MKPASAFSILCAWLTCGCATVQPIDSLVETERAFAALSLAKDTRTAFLSFLDDSAVIFRPHPVNGKEFVGRQPARPSLLAWKPVFADCSEGGDLGFTTGPWTFSSSRSDAEPVAFGYFVTVWGRRPDGSWKALLDIGTSNPKPSGEGEPMHLGPLSQIARGRPESRPSENIFLQAERGLGSAVERSGVAEAYRLFAAEDCRFYREGHLPAVGYREAYPLPGDASVGPVYTLLALHESVTADLAYAYGRYEFPPEKKPDGSGYYLHIWSRSRTGSPALVLDLLSPLPRQ